jgi:hypothetical protein
MTTAAKIKGRTLYRGDRVIAFIRGYREMHATYGPLGSYDVMKAGVDLPIASGFAYFADAVKWAMWAAKQGEL